MGNNNTTPFREEESSKLDNDVKSPASQDQLFLAGEGKDRDEPQRDFVTCNPNSLTNGKVEDGINPLNESDETIPYLKEQTYEQCNSAELELSKSKGDMHPDGSENVSRPLDRRSLTQTSVSKVFQATSEEEEGELFEHEYETFGNESIERELNEAKNCVEDIYAFDNVNENASFEETDEKMIQNESEFQEESVLEEAKIEAKAKDRDEKQVDDQSKTNAKQRIEEECLMEQENHVDEEASIVAEEQKSRVLVESILQKIKPVEKSDVEVQMININNHRIMSRSRSLPVRYTTRVSTNSQVEPSFSWVACSSSYPTSLKERVTENVMEAKREDTLSVSCIRRNKAMETDTDNINGEAELEIRSPSFSSDLRIKTRTEELSSDKTPLLFEDKAEMYETMIKVEEKTITLKRSESEKSRRDVFLGLLKEEKQISDEADDHNEEIEGLGDNLHDKKASSESLKGKERRRSKASLFGTCLCCATVIN